MRKNNKKRPIKPVLDKLKTGQCSIFPIVRWNYVRNLASVMKKNEDKVFTVNKRPNTVVVTRVK